MNRLDAEPVRVRLAASIDLAGPTHPGALPPPPAPPPIAAPPGAGGAGPVGVTSTEGHFGRLRDGVRRLRATARTFKVTDRTLLVVGGVLAPIGLLVIIIGWWGAAHSPYLFQQVPYLISGGLFGLALVILGSFLYFGYWLTQVVKEQRKQAVAVVEAIERLERVAAGLGAHAPAASHGHSVDALSVSEPAGAGATAGVDHGDARSDAKLRDAIGDSALAAFATGPAVRLVATRRGTMAHRPDCVVVAGKTNLRDVAAADGLAPCKLCGPFDAAE